MESMIRGLVQEEVQRCISNSNSGTSNTVSTSGISTNATANAGSSHSRFSHDKTGQKTQNRLSNLLTKIRKGKQEKFKDIKIQVSDLYENFKLFQSF